MDDEQCTVRVMCAVSDVIHEGLIVPANVLDHLNDHCTRYVTVCSSPGADCHDSSERNDSTISINNRQSSCDKMVVDRDLLANHGATE
jgi:hypothetical protein